MMASDVPSLQMEYSTTPRNIVQRDPLTIGGEFANSFTFWVTGVVCTLLSLVGLVTNTINVYIFVAQGLQESVNITLVFLSASDFMMNLLTMLMGVCYIFNNAGLFLTRIDWIDLLDVAFTWTRVAFTNISKLVTVCLTLERAICVIFPLKVKDIFTPRKTVILLVTLIILAMSTFVPVFATSGLSWQGNNATTVPKLQVWYKSNRRIAETVTVILGGLFNNVFCLTCVIICSQIIVLGLRASAVFRKRTGTKNPSHEGSETDGQNRSTKETGLSGRDKKAAVVVIFVAIVFISSMIPVTMMALARTFIVELSPGQKYENLMWVLFAVVYFIEAINSSINMFIYLTASSSYRELFYRKICSTR